jgi:hypothetical protein
MHFEIANAKGDWLRIEVPAGRFKLADGVEVEATPASPRQLTEEELRATARDTDLLVEQGTIIEQCKRLFIRLPKRGQHDGSQMRWEYWDGQQWQPYELPPPPFFFAITEFPDPDAPDFKQPPS